MKIRIIKCIGRTVMVLCLFIGTFLLLKSGIVSAKLLVAILLAGKIISLAFRVIRFFFKTVVWLVLFGILL
ncbi:MULTISPECIES: hypothetical protein [Bacteroidaceae]|uniref:Uncharacterized protein n=1 Tax=Phocaeicola barnesiae TaxID=376804 RepID=A0AAW5N004_9BACT|nr:MULTISPECIES: hypothetical protein [Bacteroidaceae]MBM6671779.1 hypothetical protein [Phocaeicola coprophilus]MBM6720228.1 hypothetical protein [Bacteroides gallinaceum]MBM6781697.1 hypothetical protein [Bacteroides mediterraneensis]MCR8874071.1 hypothetical protein [Phocaeicola barnesiae]